MMFVYRPDELFAKAYVNQEGLFKYSGKYALIGRRWHKIHKDLKVPHNAPIAAHPESAGKHAGVKLEAHEVEAQSYSADKAAKNAEMKQYNEKHLPNLLAHGEAGNATALLGAGYGVNSHALRQVKLANHLLQKMGAKHQVAAGQEAGSHEAVQEPAPGAPAAAPALEAKAAEAPALTGGIPGHQKAMLDQIPWDKLVLPDTNTNAALVNKKLAALKAAAYAGDVNAVKAMKFGLNTYNLKLGKAAQAVVMALETPAGVGVLAADGATDQIKQMASGGGATAAQAAAALEDGPKEGDTKIGKNGETLIFEKGHWHLLHQAKPKAPEPAPVEPRAVVQLKPKQVIGILATVNKIKAGNKDILKKLAVAGDMAGLQDFIAASPHFGAFKKAAKLLLAVLTGATPVPAAAPPPKQPAPAPKPVTVVADGAEKIDGWKAEGGQGGYFTDHSGVKWYCKFHADGVSGARTEILALKLYGALGLPVLDMKMVTLSGKAGTAARVIDGLSEVKEQLKAGELDSILSGFAADAWLANWEVVGGNPSAGKGFDNIQVAGGKAYRIDAGGALGYKGTGAKKSAAEWGDDVVELKTLLDPAKNKHTALVYGKITQADITASVAKVLALPENRVAALVREFGPGDEAEKQNLISKLLKRRQSMAKQYPQAVKKREHPIKPVNGRVLPNPMRLKVDPSLLPKPHDFMTMGRNGGPISTKPYVQHNIKDEKAIFDFALKGNLVALKEYKFQPVDKLTGAEEGGKTSISSHPSQHVKSFYDEVVNYMEALSNPSAAMVEFAEMDGASVDDLGDLVKALGDVPTNQRLGFWFAVGRGAHPQKFKQPSFGSELSDEAKKAAFEKYQKYPKTVRTFIKNVQSSGSANQPYRDGASHDLSGQDTRQVVADLYANASEHAEGTTCYKWINMTDGMINQILGVPEGLVFQNPGSMCASYKPTSTSGFGQHRVTIHFAKGAKAVDAFGSGKFSGEYEIITLPGARFMVLKREMVLDHLKTKPRLEVEVVMLPPDYTYLSNLNREAVGMAA